MAKDSLKIAAVKVLGSLIGVPSGVITALVTGIERMPPEDRGLVYLVEKAVGALESRLDEADLAQEEREVIAYLCQKAGATIDHDPELRRTLLDSAKDPAQFAQAFLAHLGEVEAWEDSAREYLGDLLADVRDGVVTIAASQGDGLTIPQALERAEQVLNQRHLEVMAKLESLSTKDDVSGLGEELSGFRQENRDLLGTVRERLDQIAAGTANRAVVLRGLLGPGVSSPVVAGQRPDVSSDLVTRDEWGKLKGLFSSGAAQVRHLYGLHGTGKSQLASAFAKECEERGWRFVGWVDAGTRNSVISSLARMARDLGECLDDVPDEKAARALVVWMANTEGDRLLVFDNVMKASHVKDFIPGGVGMRVILTTTEPGMPGRRILVGGYSLDQAVRYLTSRLGEDDPDDPTACVEVAQCLERLPLALNRAVSTMRLSRLSYRDYLDLVKDSERVDQAMGPRDLGYQYSVGQALRLSYTTVMEWLDAQNPAYARTARQILSALALLAESGVSREWLYCLSDDEQRARESVGLLVDNSLLIESSAESGKAKVAVHRLAARVIREDWSDLERGEACEAAIRVLTSVSHEGDHMTQRRSATLLRRQLVCLLGQSHSTTLARTPQVLNLVVDVITWACELNAPSVAISLLGFQPLIKKHHNLESALHVQDRIARACELAGDLERGIELYEHNLADRERVLGGDHRDTLASRNNLAGAYESAGDLDRAIPLYERTLADCERVLGVDHPQTLQSRNDLAFAYNSAGDLSRALPLFERTLAERERVLGIDHPQTLQSRNNLASAYELAGDLEHAIPLCARTLADRERVLGPDHPQTLTSRNDLAYAYQSAGDLGRAIPLFEQNLADRERVLGSDHPDTLLSRGNLARSYHLAGERDRALALLEQAVTDCARALGTDHPLTTSLQADLAVMTCDANRRASPSP